MTYFWCAIKCVIELPLKRRLNDSFRLFLFTRNVNQRRGCR
jgi:hypothetical protein